MKLSPIGQRRWRNFKANKRGYWSMWIFLVLFILSLFAELIANDKPLVLSYRGDLHFPLTTFYTEEYFGGEFQTEPDYTDPLVKCLIRTGGALDPCYDEADGIIEKADVLEGQQEGWAIWPLIEFSYDTQNYNVETAPAPPSAENWLGTDDQTRDVMARVIYGFRISVLFGFTVTIFSSMIGVLAGATQGFFGGWVDHLVSWLYSTFSSIPQLVLLAVLSFMFLSDALSGFRGLPSLYFAFALTYWIGPCRVIRGESMKIKELEYVQAATAIGFGRFYILLRHIIPNTSHLMFINFSLLLIAAIKGEVILTFLGLGLKQGASWGIMIRDSAQQVVNDNFWQIGAATFFMFLLVLAFNIFTDALQDALDPKTT